MEMNKWVFGFQVTEDDRGLRITRWAGETEY